MLECKPDPCKQGIVCSRVAVEPVVILRQAVEDRIECIFNEQFRVQPGQPRRPAIIERVIVEFRSPAIGVGLAVGIAADRARGV